MLALRRLAGLVLLLAFPFAAHAICFTDADCACSEECVVGVCVPGCGSHARCSNFQQCIAGFCVSCGKSGQTPCFVPGFYDIPGVFESYPGGLACDLYLTPDAAAQACTPCGMPVLPICTRQPDPPLDDLCQPAYSPITDEDTGGERPAAGVAHRGVRARPAHLHPDPRPERRRLRREPERREPRYDQRPAVPGRLQRGGRGAAAVPDLGVGRERPALRRLPEPDDRLVPGELRLDAARGRGLRRRGAAPARGEFELSRFGDGTIRFAVAPEWTWRDTGLSAPMGAWTHVVLVFDGLVARAAAPDPGLPLPYQLFDGEVRAYVSGVEVVQPWTFGEVGDAHVGMDRLRVGGRQLNSSDRFVGAIDEVAVWQRPLSSFEVALLYNAGAGQAITPQILDPATLVPTVWLDAADGSTFALSGGEVQSWADGGSSASGACRSPRVGVGSSR